MNEPLNILIATPNDELFEAFKKSFSRFDVILTQVRSYCDAVETLQNGLYDLLITDYFLEAGPQLEEAFNVRSWEVDTIEHDLKIMGSYRSALVWLRNLICKMDKEKLFPLGRRLSIEADLLPIKTIFLIPYDKMYDEESIGAAKYFRLYRDILYLCNDNEQSIADDVIKRIIENEVIDLKFVY